MKKHFYLIFLILLLPFQSFSQLCNCDDSVNIVINPSTFDTCYNSSLTVANNTTVGGGVDTILFYVWTVTNFPGIPFQTDTFPDRRSLVVPIAAATQCPNGQVSNVNVQVFYICNGSTVICDENNGFSIDIIPPPIADFSVSSNILCLPLDTTLRINDNSCPRNPLKPGWIQYFWDFGNGTNSTLRNPPDPVYTTPGIYTITQIVSSICGTDTFSRQVRVEQAPEAYLTFTDALADSGYGCVGNPIIVLDSSVFADSAGWRIIPAGAGTVRVGGANGDSLYVTFNQQGTVTIELTAFSEFCGTAICRHQLTIQSPPIVQLDPDVFACDSVCANVNLRLTGGVPDTVMYRWGGMIQNAPPPDPYCTAQNDTIFVQASNVCGTDNATQRINIEQPDIARMVTGDTTVCLDELFPIRFTSQNGNTVWLEPNPYFDSTGRPFPNPTALCTPQTIQLKVEGRCVTPDSITVIILPEPNTVLTLNNLADSIQCFPSSSVTFSLSGSCPSIADGGTYSLDMGDGTIYTGTNPPTHTYATPGTYRVVFTLTSPCGVDSAVQTIVINARDNPQFGFPDTSFCVNFLPQIPITATNRVWIEPNAYYDSTGRPITVLPSICTPQNVQLILNGDCVNPDTLNLTINPEPDVQISLQNPSDSILCFPAGPITFLSTGTCPNATGNNTTFTWDFGDGNTATGLGPVNHTYTTTGIFRAKLVVRGPCGADSAFQRIEVRQLQKAQITPDDTTLCVSDLPFRLSASLAGGIFSGAGFIRGNGEITNPSLAAGRDTTVEIYYTGFCLIPDTVRITIVNTEAQIQSPQTLWCIDDVPAPITANPAGGTFSGTGVDPVTGVFDPMLAGPGFHTIRYVYQPAGRPCPAVDSVRLEVLQLGVSFSITGCNGLNVQFDTTNTSNTFQSILWNFGDGNTSTQVSPSHSYNATGTYTVTVGIQYRGCAATFSRAIVVKPAPIISFSPLPDSICSPDSIMRTAVANDTGLIYEWFVNGISVGQGSSSPIIPLLAPFRDSAYTVRLVAVNDCYQVEYVDSIKVKALPLPFFEISDSTTCSGDTVTLVNLCRNCNDCWYDLGDGRTVRRCGTFDIQFFTDTIPRIYTIRQFIANDCDTIETIRRIRVAPTDVEANIQANRPLRVCVQDTLAIRSVSTPGAPVLWRTGDGNTYTQVNLRHVFRSPGTYTITLFVFGCGQDSTTITVEVLPRPDLELILATTDLCLGEAFDIELITNANNTRVYFGNGDSSLAQGFSYTYDQTGTFTLTAIAISPDGCDSVITRRVTVHENPLASIDLGFPWCVGRPVDLNGILISGSVQRWVWDLGNGENREGQSIQYAWPDTGRFEIRLLPTSQFGCKGDTSIGIWIKENPHAEFIVPQPICQNDLVQIIDLSDGEALTYQWTASPSGETSIESNPVFQFVTPSPGQIELILTNRYSCMDTAVEEFEVFPIPRAKDMRDTICKYDAITLFQPFDSLAIDFLWSTGETSSTILADPIETTTYWVIGSTQEGCEGDTAYITLLVEEDLPFANFDIPNFDAIYPGTEIFPIDKSRNAPILIWLKDGKETELPITFNRPGLHAITLIASNAFCADTLEKPVRVLEPDFFTPNAFTPNNDGKNDVFTIPSVGYKSRVFRIYNRWGRLIFENNTLDDGWDGTSNSRSAPEGVYVFVVTYTDFENKIRTGKGSITLIR